MINCSTEIDNTDKLDQIKKRNKFVVVLTTTEKTPPNNSNRVVREYENIVREQKDTSKNLSGTEELVKFCVAFNCPHNDETNVDAMGLVMIKTRSRDHETAKSKTSEIEDIFFGKPDTDFSPSAIKSILTSHIKEKLFAHAYKQEIANLVKFDYANSGIEKIESVSHFEKIKEDNKFIVMLWTDNKKLNNCDTPFLCNRVARVFENIAREQKNTLKNLSGTEELVKFCFFYESDDENADEKVDESVDGSEFESDDESDDGLTSERIKFYLLRKTLQSHDEYEEFDKDFDDCRDRTTGLKAGTKSLSIKDFDKKSDTDFSPGAIKSILTSNIEKMLTKKMFQFDEYSNEKFDTFKAEHEKVIVYFCQNKNDFEKYQTQCVQRGEIGPLAFKTSKIVFKAYK